MKNRISIFSRCSVTTLLICATLMVTVGSGCNPPVLTTTTIPVGFQFDLGVGPNRLARTYAFFLGTPTQSYSFNLSMSGLGGGSTLTLSSGGGGQTQTFTGNAASVTTNVMTGNTALFTFTTGLATPPSVNINSVTLTAGPGAPVVEAALGDSMRAMPIVPGSTVRPDTPVELVFDSTKRFYFLSVTGIANKNLDIVLDGPGKVLISDTTRGFVMYDDDSMALDVVNSASGGIKTVSTDGSRNTLLFTVILQGPGSGANLARFSVNEPTDLVDFSIRLNGNPSQFPGGPGALTPLLNQASQSLYQATEGRVRIKKLTVYNGTLAQPFVHTDAHVLPLTFPGGPIRPHTFPLLKIEFDLGWLSNPTGSSGWILAHELMHYRYLLRDEYRDAMPLGLDPAGVRLCPNSMMSVFGVTDLCWPGNHNPTGDPMLGTPPLNLSSWAALAPRIGVAIPTVTPSRLLMSPTGVTFPLAVVVVN